MTESPTLRQILTLGTDSVRLWRNNVGMFQDARGQWVRYGLAPGSSDLIGLRSVVITPQMVGQRVAIFAAIEVKSPRGRPSQAQRNFLAAVTELGGRAGIARSVPEALVILDPRNRA